MEEFIATGFGKAPADGDMKTAVEISRLLRNLNPEYHELAIRQIDAAVEAQFDNGADVEDSAWSFPNGPPGKRAPNNRSSARLLALAADVLLKVSSQPPPRRRHWFAAAATSPRWM